MPQTPEQAAQSMIDNLKDRTGRTLEEWFALLSTKHFGKHAEYMQFLKSEMGVSHGYANLIALKHRDAGDGGAGEDPVVAQYAGPKQGLRSILDRIVATVEKMGDDVAMVTHRIRLATPQDVDAEVKAWIKRAYDAAG